MGARVLYLRGMPCADTKPDPACTQGVRYWSVLQTWREDGQKAQESGREADRQYRHAKMVYDGHAASCGRSRSTTRATAN